MKTKTLHTVTTFTSAALLLGGITAAAAPEKSDAPVPAGGAALAEKLVGQVAGIEPDEVVQIAGSPADLPLLEDLAVAVRKRGTDLTLKILGDSVRTSDGVISPENRKQGGAACQVWLPAGEVYFRVVADSAAGRVVFDHAYLAGKDIRNLTWTVKGGRIADVTADSGLEHFKGLYDGAAPGKDRICVVDVGINPNIRVPRGSRLRNFIPAGTISVYSGDDSWAGGEVLSGFNFGGNIVEGTLTVDGKAVVENGELKVK